MKFPPSSDHGLDLARVLLVHGDLAPRLALKTILQAGGYNVDVAGTASEALVKLDTNRYELVLSDGTPGSDNLLAYARVKAYHPATAMVRSNQPVKRRPVLRESMAVHTTDVPHLLGKVADLIARRASRRRGYRQFATGS